jgi:mRNA-degrading endonuclease RelE of RelBE toxin-antitoxin system
MSKYQVHLTRSAEKDLENLGSNKNKLKVINLLRQIQLNPALGVPLTGELTGFFSLHFSLIGYEARIIYTLIEENFVILVIAIGSRENIYKLAVRRSKNL